MRERDELTGVPAAIGTVVLAVLFASVVLAIYPGWGAIGNFFVINLRFSENAPAWIQAIGSLLTVMGAGVGIYWQVQRQHRIELDRRVEKIQLIYGHFFHCRTIAWSMRELCNEGLRCGPILELIYWMKELDKISPLSMPDAQTQKCFGMVVVRLPFLEILAQQQHETNHLNQISEHCDQIFMNSGDIEWMLSSWLKSHNAMPPMLNMGFSNRSFGPVTPSGEGREGFPPGVSPFLCWSN